MSQTKAQLIEGLNINTSAPADALVIDSSGNVGIGAASPAQLLHLAGSDPVIRFTDDDDNYHHLFASSNNFYISADRNNTGSGNLIFRNGGTSERLRIDSSGLVIIGGTSPLDSTKQLTLTTTGTSGGLGILSPNNGRGDIFFGDAADDNVGQIRYSHVDNSLTIRTNTADRFVIDSTGLHTITASNNSTAVQIRDASNYAGQLVTATDGTFQINARTTTTFTRTGSNTESMRIDSSGRVGIGTTSPGCDLEIGGDGHIHLANEGRVGCNSGSGAPSDAYIKFFDTDIVTINTTDTERLRIDSSGNVIVGTSSTVNPVLRILGSSAHNSFIQFADGDSNNVGQIQYSHSSNALITAVNGSERMRIDSSGRVGIGTTSPDALLDVENSSGASEIQIKSLNASDCTLAFGDNADTDVGRIRYAHSADAMLFFTAASERMRIDISGSVQIGGSVDAGDRLLQIQGNSSSTAAVLIAHSVAAANQSSSISFAPANNVTGGKISCYAEEDFSVSANRTARLEFYTRKDGTLSEKMRIDSSGNVGIGTTSPSRLLEIKSSAPIIRLTESTNTYSEISANSSVLSLKADEGNGAGSTRIDFRVDGSEAMRIYSSGRVGIGTASPGANLQVERGDSHSVATFKQTSASYNCDVAFDHSSAAGTFLASRRSSGDFWLYQSGAYNIVLSTNSSERVRILSGGGLTFNGDTAQANALDDYEEGTWTPTYNLGTLTVYTAHYIKIGNHVTYQAYMTFPSSTNTNEVILSGFPFNAAGGNDYHVCAINTDANLGYQLVGQYNRANNGQFQLAKPDNSKATGANMSGKFVILTLNVMLH